jgi:DNA replication protein DnaC
LGRLATVFGRIAETLADRLVLADKQQMTFDDLLLLVLTDEISRRDSTAADVRAREAGLDSAMRLELWDKPAKVSFDKRMLSELVSLRFLEAHRHVVALGPVGVGKTFVAQALGHIACRHGYHVRFWRSDAMLRTLRQSRFDNSRDNEMIGLTTVDLLVLDDFALEPMSKEESKDVYQLFLERTGRASMIITSNRDTAEWLSMFDDMLLAQSAVDRFKNTAYDFVIEGESYRPRLRDRPRLVDQRPSRGAASVRCAPDLNDDGPSYLLAVDGSQPEAATARGKIERTLAAAGILPAPDRVFEGHGLFGSHKRHELRIAEGASTGCSTSHCKRAQDLHAALRGGSGCRSRHGRWYL